MPVPLVQAGAGVRYRHLFYSALALQRTMRVDDDHDESTFISSESGSRSLSGDLPRLPGPGGSLLESPRPPPGAGGRAGLRLGPRPATTTKTSVQSPVTIHS